MRNLLAILCLMLVFTNPTFAAFGANSAWDVKPSTGANTNGGAFDSGVASPGTDESTGSGTAITITTASTTTGTGSPAFSATTHGPGNFVHIASGTGCTVGWHEITSQSAGTATFESAIADMSGRTCVGVIGGALATWAQAETNAVTGNVRWLQAATYTLSATQTVAVSGAIIGYTTNHGDCNSPSTWGTCITITTSTNSVSPLIKISQGSGITFFRNASITTTAGTPAEAFATGTHGNALWYDNVSITGAFTKAIDCDNGTFDDCTGVWVNRTYISGATSFAIYMNPVAACYLNITGGSLIAGNNAYGIGITGQVASNCDVTMDRSVIGAPSSGSSSNLQPGNSVRINVRDSVIYGAAGDNIGPNLNDNVWVENSIIYGAGLRGVNCNNATFCLINFVGAGGNTSGNFNMPTGQSDTNTISLSANPFVNAATGNYALNSTAGGGAALKATGFPGIFANNTTTGTPDVGAAQTACAAGGGSSGSMCVQ